MASISATPATPDTPTIATPSGRRRLVLSVAWLLGFALLLASDWLATQPGGRAPAFALLVGASLGLVFQRSRFCFYCHARDWFEQGDPRGLLAILLALAVGTVGYQIVVGSWLPVPVPGRLPPDAHIGPVSWALVLAGLAFGLGMRISGSCISAHLYRLGEGASTSPFALLGVLGGFILGYASWNSLYSLTIATAPKWWLPHWLGYGGTALAQLAVLGALAAWLWQRRTADIVTVPEPASPPGTARDALARLFTGRWPYWSGGALVGLIGFVMLQRIPPLGVTSPLGNLARRLGEHFQWVPERLEGLDTFAGCATLVSDSWLTVPNLLVLGLLPGALAAALASGQWQPRRPNGQDILRGLSGGLLLGWGAMTALGCTVGTLLSGTQAGAVSGWVFGLATLAGVWIGLKAVPTPAARQASASP